MKILILGAGKMGSFFTDVLSFEHEVAVYDVNPQRLRFMYNCYRFTKLEEISEFKPELVINAATVKYTLDAFHQVLPVLPKDCIISDIASVKTGLKEFYENCGFRYAPGVQEEADRVLNNDMDELAEFSKRNDNVDFAGRIVWQELKDPCRGCLYPLSRGLLGCLLEGSG